MSSIAKIIGTESIKGEPTAVSDSQRCPEQNSITVIEPRSGWRLINIAELWQFRELLGFLVWRDVKVRYKQTLLGAAWAILQPLLLMVVFTIFFGRMAGVKSGGMPYPLFAFAGLLPWTFFSTAIANSGNSVVGSERLISKIYFPRLSIPFATVGAALIDFAIAFSMLIILMIWYRVTPTFAILMIPVIVALIAVAALGVGALLAALNVAYRDFRYVIPFLVQLWMFATPTVYMQPENYPTPTVATTARTQKQVSVAESSDSIRKNATSDTVKSNDTDDEGAVPNYVQTLLNLNPLVGLIACFRAATLGSPFPWAPFAWSTLGSGMMFVFGCIYFRHVEDTFADII